MATNGEKPAKKGTKDLLLEELKGVANKPNPPAEVPPRDTDKADSGISAESIKSEKKEDALIDKNIKARRAAEAVATPEVSPAVPATPPAETTEQKVIPPELEHLDEGERKLYLKLPKAKQESYLAHITEVRADKEKKEKASKNKKPVKHRTQNPKAQASEKIKEMTRRMKEETAEELKQMTTARAAALKPSGAAPDAPTIKLSVDVARSEAAGKPNPDEDEEYPAVWRYNRDRRENSKAEVESPPVELEQHENVSPKAEGTPKEWREKLRGLIEGAKEKLDNVAEGVSERFTKSKEYLNNRAKEIDAQAEISGGEKWLRIIGEKYNKLSIIHKLGIGVTLGVGAAVGSAFSLPLALVGLSGLVVQRAVGAAGMFVSIEKKLQEKKVGESFQFMGVKERAALDAMLYTAVMGTAINKGLELANEYNVVERTREWLGDMFGYHPPATPGVHQSIAPAAEKIPDFKLDHPLHAPAAEMPIVGASAHGYEGMLKDLMKQLPDKPPEGITPKIDGSDIEKLFYAKLHPENISGAIHRLATDNDFFAKQGNALIDKSAHMTIVNGNIQFTDAAHPAGIFKAAADMHFTAPLHPEAPVTHVETPVVSTIPTHPVETIVAQPIPTPEVVTPPPGAEAYAPPHQPPPIAPPVEHAPVHEPAPAASIEKNVPFVSPPETHVAVSEVQPLQSETIVTPDATVEKFVSPPHTETPVANTADTISTQPFVPVIEHGFISNKFDLSIPVAEAHIYADPGVKHLLVYGGSAQERTKAMLEYFLKNPDKIIFGADADGKYRLPWHLVDGKVIPAGLPPRIGGFLGFFGFGSWMKAPEPDELAKLIK